MGLYPIVFEVGVRQIDMEEHDITAGSFLPRFNLYSDLYLPYSHGVFSVVYYIADSHCLDIVAELSSLFYVVRHVIVLSR